MGEMLGVTREWISRLERGRGEFSEIVKLKLNELAGLPNETQQHKREPAEAREALGGEGVTALRAEAVDHFDALISAAGNDSARLGWILEQEKAHLAIPSHWLKNEDLNRIAYAAVEKRRRERQQDPRAAPQAPRTEATA